MTDGLVATLSTVLIVLLSISVVVHFAALVIVSIRLSRGLSTVDRAIALDVVAATVIGITIVASIWTFRTDLLPLIIVFACTGFISSTTIARFVSHDTEVKTPLMSRAEADQLDRERERAASRDDEGDEVDDLPGITSFATSQAGEESR